MQRLRRTRIPSVLVAAALILILAQLLPGPAARAQAPGGTPTATPMEKLTPRLQALAQNEGLRLASLDDQARELSVAATGPGSLMRDDAGRLMVYIHTANLTPRALADLANAGANILHVSQTYGVVTAYVDAAGLTKLAEMTPVTVIVEELTPITASDGQVRIRGVPAAGEIGPAACTPTISEGDTQLNAALARAGFAVDGTGVKVGVLSDSFDRSASATIHAAADVASGDLPGAANPCGHLTPVSVLADSSSTSVSDEGRGMSQIVHDLAPGATLGFATAWEGLYSFADNIRALRAWGADIIVDDVYYFLEPMFQDGPVAVAIAEVVAGGGLYFTSAGNGNVIIGGSNVGSYESPAFRPIACPVSVGGTQCHDFNPGAGTDWGDQITLSNNGQVRIVLNWAEPWYGVTTDLDLYLLNGSNAVVQSSTYNSIVQQWPYENLTYKNTNGSTQSYRIVVKNNSAAHTPRLKFVIAPSNVPLQAVQYNTSTGGDIVGPTVFGHSASTSSLSVAAVPYNSMTTPETFSSRGPAAHYYGPVIGTTAASPIATEVLQQPDFTATDGGCTTFFGSFSSGCYRFYGTSAAAPHSAAVAALIKHKTNQRSVGLTQSQVKSILQTTARSMSGGNLNSVGAGLIDAYAAVQSVDGAPTPTPTVTPTSTPVPAPDVSIRKAAILGRPFTPGDRITYTLSVANLGNLPANGVRVTDTLPASLVAPISYSSNLVITSTGGANYAWTVAPLAAGASGVITVYARIDPSLPITAVVVNTAQISNPQDRDPSNNSSTAYAGGFRVYLPLVVRSYSGSADTPTPTATPTATPTTTPGGSGIHGHVTIGGVNASGVLVDLRFYDPSTYWSTFASTSTDGSGNYAFTSAPSLSAGQYYYVRYRNGQTTDTRLSAWNTRSLSAYTAGSSVAIGDFDLANITLTSPSHLSSVGLPITFYWQVRSATLSDTYELNIIEPVSGSPWWWTVPHLGYVGSYPLNVMPAGFFVGTTYGWFVAVYSPDGGYGESYYFYSITFTSAGVAAAQEPLLSRPRDPERTPPQAVPEP